MKSAKTVALGALLLVMLLQTAVPADQARLAGEPAVEPADPAYGDLLTLRTRLDLPSGTRPMSVDLPGTDAVAIHATSFEPLEGHTWRMTLEMRVFARGRFSLPPFDIVLQNTEGTRQRVRHPPVRIALRSRLPEKLPQPPSRLLRPPHGPLRPLPSWIRLAVWVLLTLYLALTTLTVIRHFMRKGEWETALPSEPVGDLRTELDRLMVQSPELTSEQFYERFSWLLRRELGPRLRLPVEYLTPEVLRREAGGDRTALQLAELLMRADHGRFGPTRNAQRERREDVDRALELYDGVGAAS